MTGVAITAVASFKPSNLALHPHARHPCELSRVVGHDDQALAARAGRDQHVVWAGRLSLVLQLGANLAMMRGGADREVENLKPRNELRDRLQVCQTPR